jgi:hypothetical protein
MSDTPTADGRALFVDYAGQTVPIVDRATGEVREAQVFVGVLGASNFTYSEGCWSQELPEWIGAHVRMYEYFGGVPQLTIPDNLKAGVRHPCYYEPDINPTYHEMAVHYGTAVLPARIRKPRDKAKAEAGVLLVERWILARLRHHTFFTLADLNQCIRALPKHPYEYVEIRRCRVNIDYHIEFHQHHYSVPHQYVGEQVDIHASERLVQIYFRQRQIASHPRSHQFGTSTESGHMPTRHQKSPDRNESCGRQGLHRQPQPAPVLPHRIDAWQPCRR